MKILVKLLLVFFLTFLSTPTILSMVEKKGDITFINDNSETDDFQKDIKIKIIFESYSLLVFNPQLNSICFLSKNLIKHDSISQKIVIPPPDSI